MACSGANRAADQGHEGEALSNRMSVKVGQVAALLTGRRWCSHCQGQRPEQGGKWKVSANGMNKRWKCAACVERAKERAAKKNQ